MYLQEIFAFNKKDKEFEVICTEREIKDIRAVLDHAYTTYICKAEDSISPVEKHFAMRDAEIAGVWVDRITRTLNGEDTTRYKFDDAEENRFVVYLDSSIYQYANTFREAVARASDLRETISDGYMVIQNAEGAGDYVLAKNELVKLACKVPALPCMEDVEDFFDWYVNSNVITIQDSVTRKKWNTEELP